LYWPHDTIYPQKVGTKTSPTSSSRSVGIVHLRTKITEFVFCFLFFPYLPKSLSWLSRSPDFPVNRNLLRKWEFRLVDNVTRIIQDMHLLTHHHSKCLKCLISALKQVSCKDWHSSEYTDIERRNYVTNVVLKFTHNVRIIWTHFVFLGFPHR
jgi:hypothetical protein